MTADRKWIEAEAARLGAKPATIAKWRHRGISARWQLRLIERASRKLSPAEISAAFPAYAPTPSTTETAE